MSNLTSNTTELQSILDAVNALPEAGGGSVLDNIFEIAETFTPAEDTMSHDFYFPEAGGYVIVSNPPASPELAVSLSKVLPEMAYIRVRNSAEVDANQNHASCWTAAGTEDYWSSIITNVSPNVFNVAILYNRHPYRAGFTYYLLRCNW